MKQKKLYQPTSVDHYCDLVPHIPWFIRYSLLGANYLPSTHVPTWQMEEKITLLFCIIVATRTLVYPGSFWLRWPLRHNLVCRHMQLFFFNYKSTNQYTPLSTPHSRFSKFRITKLSTSLKIHRQRIDNRNTELPRHSTNKIGPSNKWILTDFSNQITCSILKHCDHIKNRNLPTNL